MQIMDQWRQGMASDSEAIRQLVLDLHEIQQAMYSRETKEAEDRIVNLDHLAK